MPILNYTTSIACEKSIMEIQQCLVKHGASKIITDYTGTLPTSITFIVSMNGNPRGFSLPANYKGVLKAMGKDKKVPRRLLTDEQALRVSWRIVKVWIDAQMAIVESELADMAEVFLPYVITKSGGTLYAGIKNGNNKLLLE